MKTFRVEVMTDETVESHHSAVADSPWEAAEKATGRAIKGKRDEQSWVRVTDEADRAVFKYAFN